LGGQTRYKGSVRRIVLLTVAGLASLFGSFFGAMSWMWSGAGASHSAAQKLFCIFPMLTLAAFCLYFLRPIAGLTVSWLIPSGTYVSIFLVNLQSCMTGGCTTTNSISIAWGTLTRDWRLEAVLVAPALCLLLDYTGPTPVVAPEPAPAPEGSDHDLRT
jgi:hypothetical protein